MSARMRMTRSKTGSRRANHALVGPRVTKDAETGEPRLRHRVSPTTGRYRGRMVVDVAAALAKREEKLKARERAAAQMGAPGKEQKPQDEEKPVEAPKQEELDAGKLSQRSK